MRRRVVPRSLWTRSSPGSSGLPAGSKTARVNGSEENCPCSSASMAESFSPTGNPFSHRSIAGANTSARLSLPKRSCALSQPSTRPGTETLSIPFIGMPPRSRVELPGGAGRCRAGGVEAVHLPRGGVVDQDEPVSSHPGHRQLHHPESGRGGDSRIHGAAPCLHRADAGLGGERVPRGDGAVAARAPRGGTKDGLRRGERTLSGGAQPRAARSGCMTTRSKLSPITSMPSASGWHSSSA